jgi:hypothetical protein
MLVVTTAGAELLGEVVVGVLIMVVVEVWQQESS